jgi:hypothetical protein
MFFGNELNNESYKKETNQNKRTHCITYVQGHGQKISRCFTQGGRAYLHYPKIQGYLWKLAHFIISSKYMPYRFNGNATTKTTKLFEIIVGRG